MKNCTKLVGNMFESICNWKKMTELYNRSTHRPLQVSGAHRPRLCYTLVGLISVFRNSDPTVLGRALDFTASL